MYIDQIYAKKVKKHKKIKDLGNKNVAKTAGNMKLSQQNLAEWKDIEA